MSAEISRKDAKAQRLRQNRNSRKKAQKTQKERRVFGKATFFDLQIQPIYPVPTERPFLALFFALFVPFRGYFDSSVLALAAWRELFFCFWLCE